MRFAAGFYLFLGSCLPAFPDRDLPGNPETDWDADGYTERDGDCNDEDPSLSPETLWYTDEDQDGYGDNNRVVAACEAPKGATLRSGDCDDLRADVRPSAEEVCNLRDDDCDGWIDDADTTVGNTRAYYTDADGDGHGDVATLQSRCEQPEASVTTLDDCDDLRADVFPGAPEVCDSADNDCDSRVDDEDDDVLAAPSWYQDTDGDGYGDPAAASAPACVAPEGHVALAGDCQDLLPEVHPDAEEHCDGFDNDCDGLEDGQDPDVVDALLYYEDLDADGYGNADATRLSCDERVGWVTISGDCDDLDWTVYTGALEECDGVDDDCDAAIDDECVWASGLGVVRNARVGRR